MASTFSTSLRLELMATGDQSGTWGDTTNTNLGTLLEQAITGVLSVAQGDVANLTLTSLDGTSDQARNAVINVTGAMTAARNVIVPTANKLYLAKNSTTGGFAVTFKTNAGTGVSVAAGTAQWVYCDGTNVVQGLSGTLAAQAAASVAITGGTITGLTSLTLASGAATPVTNDAAALGTSTLMWSDLFLAAGAVINWNNGDATITHSADLLAFAGASSGYTFDVPIAAASGGTGFASYTAGDLLYASGTTAFTKLAKGTAGQVLTMNAGATAPQWSTISSTSAASQAEMETGTSTTTYVSPGRQQYHDSAVKAHAQVRYTAGVPSISSSYNISGVTDNGTGDITFTFTKSMSSNSFVYGAGLVPASGITTTVYSVNFNQPAGGGSIRCSIVSEGASEVDPTQITFWAMGDL